MPDLTAMMMRAGDVQGDGVLGALLDLATGIALGVSVQGASFCLRAGTVQFGRGRLRGRVMVWLLTFSTARIWVQTAWLPGLFRAWSSCACCGASSGHGTPALMGYSELSAA